MKNIGIFIAAFIILLSNCTRTETVQTYNENIASILGANDTAEIFDVQSIVEIPEAIVSNTQELNNEMLVGNTVVPWTVGLRLRETPAITANIICTLGLWEKLTVVETRDEIENINGNNGNWIKVRRENSQETGWVFNYFLDIIEVDNFFPIWEYNNGDVQQADIFTQVFTFHIHGRNERHRQRLVLFWENKQIDIFDRAILSDNGRVMAFNWVDTATISRDASEGIISGNRHLFVYNFSNHNLIKIDEHYMRQSDRQSERWANNAELLDFGEAAGFFRDNNLENFILNLTGTKIFYNNGQQMIQVDLTTSTRTIHQIDPMEYFIMEYMGNLIKLRGRDEPYFFSRETVLYNPLERRMLTEFNFHSPVSNNDLDWSSYYPEIIIQERYLVISQRGSEYTGLLLHDLLTNQQRRLEDIKLQDIHNEYLGEWSYVVDPSRGTNEQNIAIRIIDFDNVVFSSWDLMVRNQIASGTVYSEKLLMNRY